MTDTAGAVDLDSRVEAFEAAWAGGPPDLGRFLPPPADRGYFAVLTELVRVDLEFRHARGTAAGLDRYRAAFPALFADTDRVRALAFEEYRLRAEAGDRPRADDYARRYGIDAGDWPPPPEGTAVVAVAPTAAGNFPEPGGTVLDLRLVGDLGRGSFGRVYLAEQTGLAGRRVAVKLSTRFGAAEPETMARLQHTHIVPVYSTATVGPFQVVVMPFLGASTLADVLAALRGRTEWPASGKELAETLANCRSRTHPLAAPAPDPVPVPVAAATLARFTLPEAVLWVGAKLADALAHAHARGVLHRDVKPANVLLTDDGLPMLLDFNLADDAGRAGPRESGGTPAYMAPEQFPALRGGPPTDARADLFSLGVVLFELLTGRHPYPKLAQQTATDSPRLRDLNPAVSPSTEAILRRCIHPDPARRYPTAESLADDLDRQLKFQPLLHTREPSARERLTKWRRRHPKLASSGSVAAAAAVALALVGGLAVARHRQADRLERQRQATTALAEFRPAVAETIDDLAFHSTDPRRRAAGVARADALFDRYGRPDATDWAAHAPAADLPPADRQTLRTELADLLSLRSRAEPDPTLALALNGRASIAFALASPGEPASLAVAWDRAKLLAALGRTAEAEGLRNSAPSTVASARDFYLEGLTHQKNGACRDAAQSFEEATRIDPTNSWAWLALGLAYRELGREADAEGCFHACVALRPELPMGFFNRGLVRLRRGKFAAAEDDFTAALELRPDWTPALADRALARIKLGRHADAIADLTAALAGGAPETRIDFLRAEAKAAAGDAAGAAADRATGLARTPADEESWVTRGLYRAERKDTAGALADFDAALAVNPRSFPALQNKAFVLSAAGRDAEAIVALGEAVRLFPDGLLARSGRAVLLARRGDRAAAHADAEHCLKLAPPADTIYQLAGAYAQTSTTHPEDARTAFRLLADALRQGAGFADLDDDPDLAPLRSMPEFRAVVGAARAVRVAQKSTAK